MNVTYFHRNKKAGYSIFKVSKTLCNEISKTQNVKEYFVPTHRAGLFSIFRNLYYVFKHRDKHGINHITGDIHYCIIALIGCRSVLTIHDINTLDFTNNTIKKGLMNLLWFKLPLLFAKKVVCISQHTKSRLMKITSRKDIDVIYNAIDPMYNLIPKYFNKQNPVVLHIGTTWNKNLINTIKALAPINCHLIIIGIVDELEYNLLNHLNIHYSVKSYLSDKELLEEYINCDIVSFCSLYEGFGMPIIEGNAVGRCVITSSFTPMTEIGSNAVYNIDPTNVISIREGFEKLISDDVLKNELIKNGIFNLQRFNVKNISASYINIYNRLSIDIN